MAVAGGIGFVGLVVPHLLRILTGADHRYLLKNSVLLGAILVIGADLLARNLVVPAELPIGVVTAFIGARRSLFGYCYEKMFEARNIRVEIARKKLLDNVSININPGEMVAVLGANGAGKSTLLKSLCGDSKLAGGEIKLENRSLQQWNHCELARKRAVLSQNPTFNFRSRLGNCAFGQKSAYSRERIETRFGDYQ